MWERQIGSSSGSEVKWESGTLDTLSHIDSSVLCVNTESRLEAIIPQSQAVLVLFNKVCSFDSLLGRCLCFYFILLTLIFCMYRFVKKWLISRRIWQIITTKEHTHTQRLFLYSCINDLTWTSLAMCLFRLEILDKDFTLLGHSAYFSLHGP